MDPKLWREIERVFDEVAGLPQQAREERLALVPDAVRDEVRQLLIADEEAAGLIRGAVMEVGEEVELDDLHSGPSHFGPWRVTGILGQGGMGAVYRAIRNDRAFEKEVAIKVLRLGEMDDTSRARFAQERRILALLEHPNIARLIDGGEDSSGNAYIVMECVWTGQQSWTTPGRHNWARRIASGCSAPFAGRSNMRTGIWWSTGT